MQEPIQVEAVAVELWRVPGAGNAIPMRAPEAKPVADSWSEFVKRIEG